MTEEPGFFTRLARAQAEFTDAVLDETNPHRLATRVRDRTRPIRSISEACKPALLKVGIAVLHESAGDAEVVRVRTILKADDGEYDAGWVSIPLIGQPLQGGSRGPIDAQSVGAAITYAKRYGLELALGVGREDEESIDQQPLPQPQRQAPRQAPKTKPPQAEQPNAAGAAVKLKDWSKVDLDKVDLENLGQLMELANKVFSRPVASVLHALGVDSPSDIGDPNEALRQLRTLWTEDGKAVGDAKKQGGNGD